MFVEQFAAALLIALVWLVACKVIRKLRRKPGLCYSIASAVALVTCLTMPNGLTPAGMVAGVGVLAILYLLYRRALKKHSFDAATIISYEKRDVC
jgi:hypothetical protein